MARNIEKKGMGEKPSGKVPVSPAVGEKPTGSPPIPNPPAPEGGKKQATQ